MGRFTAWMASRRQAKRTANAAARSRRNARPLSFERCEQRIALSTNEALVDPTLYSVFGQGYVVGESRPIVAVSGAGIEYSNWKANTSSLFYNDAGISADFNGSSTNLLRFLQSADSRENPYGGEFLRFDLSNMRIQPHSASADSVGELEFAGVFIIDSPIIPIPPPSSEPNGGNEGGQIAMTPFIAPSMLGLPGGGQSQLAAETRQSLTAEQLESAQATGATQQDSLRGRAVVYEVAHARPLNAEPINAATKLARLDVSADEAAATGEFELARASRPTGLHNQTQSNIYEASTAATHAGASRVALAIERTTEQVDPGSASVVDAAVAAKADEQSPPLDDESAIAAAHDAALEELKDEFEPMDEQREVAAATVDMHGKRVLGGALIAVAAIPVAKVARRRGQRPVEARPRQTTPTE